MRVELGGTTGDLDRGITGTEEDREATDALAHTQTRKYIENRNQTTQRKRDKCKYVYVYICIRIKTVTTGKPVRQNTGACSRAQRSEMETLPEALGRSAEQSRPPENLRRTAMENDRGEELHR